MNEFRFALTPIGRVESPLTDLASAPRQGDEGAPDAWLAFEPTVLDGLEGLHAGDEVLVFTWLDRARRDVLRVHPRGDASRAQQGVFSTRSPHRPNPIGLHRVEILAIERGRLHVRNLEAVDGTPIVDVKPTLSSEITARESRRTRVCRSANEPRVRENRTGDRLEDRSWGQVPGLPGPPTVTEGSSCHTARTPFVCSESAL